jgi:hypothetical protein
MSRTVILAAALVVLAVAASAQEASSARSGGQPKRGETRVSVYNPSTKAYEPVRCTRSWKHTGRHGSAPGLWEFFFYSPVACAEGAPAPHSSALDWPVPWVVPPECPRGRARPPVTPPTTRTFVGDRMRSPRCLAWISQRNCSHRFAGEVRRSLHLLSLPGRLADNQ